MGKNLVKQLVVMAAGLACAVSTATAKETDIPVPAENPDYVALYSQFDSEYLHGKGASLDDNSTGTLAWVASYHMLGLMQQYRVTSDTKWLDKVVTHFDRILAKRDDRLGRKDVHTSTSLKGWGTASYDKAGWHVYVVHTGMVSQGPAQFIREVQSNNALRPKYGEAAARYLKELEDQVADAQQFWKEIPERGEGYYTDPGMAGDGIMPLNMISAMSQVELDLYHITGKKEYLDRVTKYATFFKNCLRDNGEGGYNWAYWPKTSKDKVGTGEDISHASLNVVFAARCTESKVVFTQEDMVKFANTWLKKVSKDDGTWAAFVDGSGVAEKAYLPQAHGRWLPIVEVLPKPLARQVYEDIARAFAGSVIHLPSRALGVVNLAYYGNQLK